MKNIILITLLVFTFAYGYAQTQFPSKDGEWFIKKGDPERPTSYFTKAYVLKDTIINNIDYSIIQYSVPNLEDVSIYGGRGAVRTVNEKVYFVDLLEPNEQEYLLYDFGLHLNDTVTLYNMRYYPSSSLWTVTTVDIVNLGGTDRKRLKLRSSQYGSDQEWIEGIGSTFGPVYPIFHPYFEKVIELMGYAENGELIYGRNPVSSLLLSNNESIIVHDNTAKCLIINSSNDKKWTLKVYDQTGKLVIDINNSISGSIDISMMKSGLYICHAAFEGKLHTKRIIIH